MVCLPLWRLNLTREAMPTRMRAEVATALVVMGSMREVVVADAAGSLEHLGEEG